VGLLGRAFYPQLPLERPERRSNFAGEASPPREKPLVTPGASNCQMVAPLYLIRLLTLKERLADEFPPGLIDVTKRSQSAA